jgi:hypothetical protein
VVESRRIFRKLKAYVTYRFAASIQIVVVLTLFIYISNCPIEALFIILLALFNDLTMLPIAYDYQQASSKPENPDVTNILAVSGALGGLEVAFTLLFAYANGKTGFFADDYTVRSGCSTPTQAAVWLQMFIATELLIFSARAPTYIWLSLAPSPALTLSVFTGCMVASLMAGLSTDFGSLQGTDILLIWFYNIICLIVIDVTKVSIYKFYNLNLEVLKDAAEAGPVSISEKAAPKGLSSQGDSSSIRSDAVTRPDQNEDFSRGSMAANRLTDWAIQNNDRLSMVDKTRLSTMRNTSTQRGPRSSNALRSTDRESEFRISVSRSVTTGVSGELRPSLVGGSLRPNTPANRYRN